jgi:hypothetical protein
MDERSTVAAVAALQASLISTSVSLDFSESNDVGFSSGSENLGWVDASVSVTAHTLPSNHSANAFKQALKQGSESR